MRGVVVLSPLRRLAPLGLALALLSCGRPADDRPIRVEVIARPGEPAPAAGARGLVRFDASGQVTPDLAARWAITDDGLDYIFRIEDGVPPRLVARRLHAILAARRNPLHSWFAPITHIDAVTSTVVEMRLSSPMPDLLALLARPELALPGFPALPADPAAPRIVARADRPGRAVAAFAVGKGDIVLGVAFADFPIVQAARLPADTIRRDKTTGLFGFAPLTTVGPAADPAIRAALALAIDRDRIVALVGNGGDKATDVAGSIIEPPLPDRIAAARATIATPITLRLAMPEGPGARLLFRLIAQDWSRIGVTVISVPAGAPADLALVDQIVPPGALMRVACAVSTGCDQRDPAAFDKLPFIPIMAPPRWSLVAPGISGFVENSAAAHPLELLRRFR